jgi:hypothetical protein
MFMARCHGMNLSILTPSKPEMRHSRFLLKMALHAEKSAGLHVRSSVYISYR